jgi:hypothetical protein
VGRILRTVGERERYSLDAPVERIVARAVVLRHRRAGVLANVQAIVGREDDGERGFHASFAGLLPIDEEAHLSALAGAAAAIRELHAHLVVARWNGGRRLHVGALEATVVVTVFQLAGVGIQAPASDVRSLRDDHAFGAAFRHHDRRRHGVRLVLEVQHIVLEQVAHAAEQDLRLAFDQDGRPVVSGFIFSTRRSSIGSTL